jgi:DNA topoisomerase-1
MTTLVIVESPSKAKTINKYLGSDYIVKGSLGHVVDLPSNELGVDLQTYEPTYQPTDTGRKILATLRAEAKKCDEILLATDLDREGEAIAFHLANALKIKSPKRIVYNEITKAAILTAFENPRAIDMAMVESQETRRVVDRLIGFLVSPMLSTVLQTNSSAGRVQSPALAIIFEREHAIKTFKPIDHFTVCVEFDGWKANLDTKPLLGANEYLTDKSVLDEIALASKQLQVKSFASKERKVKPKAPFTTLSMINAASTALKLTSDRITACAQKLYENGLITYLRTDATFIADSAFSLIKEYGQDNQLPMVDAKNEWSSTEGAQEAHECIRPSDISIKETDLGSDENNLYKLIWQRTIASQMQPAIYDTHTIELTPTADIDYPLTYNATASTLTSAGWTTIYNDLEATENDEQASLPELTEGVSIDGTATVLAKKTRAPKRFTDASLAKELDSRGIGRPSTYASLVKGLLAKKYLVQDKKLYLTPTQSGADVYMALRGQFAFLNANYTNVVVK